MTKTFHRLYLDFEKEERWLNEMAARGLNLVRYRPGAYTFDEGAPGEWIYRIQFLDDDVRKPGSREYLAFVADTGAEPAVTHARWAYFRKPAAEGPFELFSDLDSRLAHYKRLLAVYSAMSGFLSMVLVIGVSRIVKLAEEFVGRFWGLPIFVPYVALLFVFIWHTLRISKRVKELEARRAIEE